MTNPITGTDGNDYLLGTPGDDTMDGGVGNDTLVGGPGNDLFLAPTRLDGPLMPVSHFTLSGDDTYLFDPGFGQDTIDEDKWAAPGGIYAGTTDDTVKFGAGISPADMVVSYPLPGYLKISFTSSTDTLTLAQYFKNRPSIEWFEFSDGTRLSNLQLVHLADPDRMLTGTTSNDTLGYDSYGYFNDTIRGLSGDDSIFSAQGNDLLEGGLGNDTIDAGLGQDTLIFNQGDGRDVVSLEDAGGTDTIVLGSGINKADVTVGPRVGNGTVTDGDITLNLGGTDSITLRSVDKVTGLAIRFANGDVLTGSEILTLSARQGQIGTEANDTLAGYASGDTMQGLGGDDRLSGYAGNDQLDGGNGHDFLDGGEGADILIGGSGNDTLDGGIGADTLEGGAGDDLLLGKYGVVADLHGLPVWITSDADTYLFNAGFGHDTIQEEEANGPDPYFAGHGPGNDIIQFGVGILAKDLVVSKIDGRHLLISSPVSSDTLLFNVSPVLGIDLINFADGTQWNAIDLMRSFSPTLVTGTASDDILVGTAPNDTLRGLAGNDILNGGDGNDMLDGGQGNDVISTGAGLDTVIFNLGDGHDTLSVDNGDVINLGSGLGQTQMQVSPLASNTAPGTPISLSWSDTDALSLSNPGTWDGLTVRFSDGSTLKGTDIVALARKAAEPPVVPGIARTGTKSNDNLTGAIGNDTLSGLAGNDLLTGLAGNDTLSGGDGKDTLIGGLGNDRLIGGKGNDIYKFSRQDGQDAIIDQDSTWFNSDVLNIAGASSHQLWLTKSGNNLNINLIGTTDQVTIEGWYTSANNRVEKIVAGDGKTLSAASVNALVTAMAAFTPPASTGASNLESATEAKLSKLLSSSWK
jgi:Ca2+-binding RTX toxin-like protein